jgi:hypothetical protein
VIAGADLTAANKNGYTPLSAAEEVRKEAPALYAAIEQGKAEGLRRAEEERRLIAAELHHSFIQETIESIGNGLDSEMSIMKPVRLAK